MCIYANKITYTDETLKSAINKAILTEKLDSYLTALLLKEIQHVIVQIETIYKSESKCIIIVSPSHKSRVKMMVEHYYDETKLLKFTKEMIFRHVYLKLFNNPQIQNYMDIFESNELIKCLIYKYIAENSEIQQILAPKTKFSKSALVVITFVILFILILTIVIALMK